MRWTHFFSHLEHDFAVDAHPDQDATLSRDTVDSHLLDVCARAKASGGFVTVGVVTGEVLHVSPRAVATEWFSGLVGNERGSGVVIPVAAVEWIEGGLSSSPPSSAPALSATFADVLADIARRSASVTIRTRRSDFAGCVVRVGDGYVDAVGSHSTHSTPSRRFSTASIVAVFQGAATWG